MKINAWTAGAGLCVVFAAGAATTYFWAGRRTSIGSPAADGRAGTAASSTGSSPGDVITIAPEFMQRSGIVTEVVGASGGAQQLRVPGTVQPNAYRKVSVTALVGGRVSRVLVELGQSVSRGTVLAEVYSPEVAQARAGYVSAAADMHAGEAKLRRTERLAALGSASQQELDEVRAEHVRHETELREAAARLRLFGLNPARMGDPDPDAESAASIIRVTAPQSGVVIERPVTAGMTAEPSTPLVTIADLSPVWVIAEVYERDLARVSTGAAATVTSEAYPGLQVRGRVTYLSPDVRPETRTTQVRVEVPNADGKLRFGMYVTVTLGAETAAAGVTVPASAVQTIGSDAVVFVTEGSAGNAFKERRVTLGPASGDRVAVTNGLAAGDRVVTQGSFTLRAEAERLGIRPRGESAGPATGSGASGKGLSVMVTAKGFEPSALTVPAGEIARITFTRNTDGTCAKEVVFPDYGIRRPLPLNTAVTVEFMPKTKEVAFVCGMNMFSGTVTVVPR